MPEVAPVIKTTFPENFPLGLVAVCGVGGFWVLASALPEAITLAIPAALTAPIARMRRRIVSVIALP